MIIYKSDSDVQAHHEVEGVKLEVSLKGIEFETTHEGWYNVQVLSVMNSQGAAILIWKCHSACTIPYYASLLVVVGTEGTSITPHPSNWLSIIILCECLLAVGV